jgi:NDP-hexose-3-ketoreductase
MRFGVLGCASIAERMFLPALNRSPSGVLSAVASRSEERARQFSDRFGGEPVVGYDELLHRDDVDAVYIALPTGLHAEWCIAAAGAGKHILCEKTLTADHGDTLAVAGSSREAGVALMEGFAYRHHPRFTEVVRLIESGAIGEPILIEARFGVPAIPSPARADRSLGGGALLDVGTYPIHLARTIASRTLLGVEASLWSADDAEVDLRGSAQLTFEGGLTAQLAWGFANGYRNTYAVWGDEGHVAVPDRAFSHPAEYEGSLVLETHGGTQTRTIPAADHFMSQIEAFIDGHADQPIREDWISDAIDQSAAIDAVARASEGMLG